MKLCITASGPELDSITDSSFGRAPWLLIVDTGTMAVEAVQNSSAAARQGAGIAAAQLIADHGAEALLTGRVGPKARAALDASGIRVYEGLARETVREALQRFMNKELSAAPAGDAAPGAAGGAGGGGCQGRGMGRGQGRGQGQCGRGRR
ncbi:MAG TPA: dinitrogenase iron-molybdenum cofactor biosynthesis protein [Desulfobulbus sp.]|nr:dinitrogenase iron-molybdenum cofactor biosynthesis protein [Desulfobulbus sp.]